MSWGSSPDAIAIWRTKAHNYATVPVLYYDTTLMRRLFFLIMQQALETMSHAPEVTQSLRRRERCHMRQISLIEHGTELARHRHVHAFTGYGDGSSNYLFDNAISFNAATRWLFLDNAISVNAAISACGSVENFAQDGSVQNKLWRSRTLLEVIDGGFFDPGASSSLHSEACNALRILSALRVQ